MGRDLGFVLHVKGATGNVENDGWGWDHLATLWRMGCRKAGVAAGKQEGMVVAGVMERNGGLR